MYTSRILTSSSRTARIAPTRALHVSSRAFLPKETKGQAPDAARVPEENTMLDQNPHLKHATSSKGGKEGRDVGKGNAAPDPELPSRKLEGSKGQAPSAARGIGNEKRKLHTSARASAEDDNGKHTADSYFKDVDENPPTSEKTFRVEGGNEATHRPNEQYADPKKEYATVSKDEPYEPPVEENGSGTGREKGEQKEQKLRYGATNRDPERDAPRRDEGPDAKDAGGRKP